VALDHLVLTVADVETTVSFYEKLGMRRETFGEGRVALRFGDQKINLHPRGAELSPNAANAKPGDDTSTPHCSPAAVRGTRPVPVDPWDAVATAEVLDAARQSAETGQVIMIESVTRGRPLGERATPHGAGLVARVGVS
jgi:catechol 2,3-dioxygenase-like lactoylglutathione lyase family enzyme